MYRLLGWVAHPGLSLRDVLGNDSFAAFAQLSRIHADGWGIAHTDGAQVRVHTSTVCAATDPEFLSTATDLVAEAGLAHLRWASPGLPVEERNTHPFLHDGAALAHNGGIYPLDQLSGLLPADWASRLHGTTDSEHYFLALLAEVEANGVDLPTAVARVGGPAGGRLPAEQPQRHAADHPGPLRDQLPRPVGPATAAAPERTVDGLVESVEDAAPTTTCATGAPTRRWSSPPRVSPSRRAVAGSSSPTTRCSSSTGRPWRSWSGRWTSG